MSNIFIISDLHIGHTNILTFELGNGQKMRPQFANVDEMDEYLIQEHNKIVRLKDKYYDLGDVAFGKKNIKKHAARNGHGRLVRGNHDDEPTKCYLEVFEEIYGTRHFKKDGAHPAIVFSHVPLHPESLRDGTVNVHGHVHNNVGPLHFGPKYFNVSCEVLDYRPIELSELRERIKKQQETYYQQYLAENMMGCMGDD